MSKPSRKKKPKWVGFDASLAPDPRQSDKSRERQRFVHALILKDDRGRLFEKLGRNPPSRIDDPPED